MAYVKPVVVGCGLTIATAEICRLILSKRWAGSQLAMSHLDVLLNAFAEATQLIATKDKIPDAYGNLTDAWIKEHRADMDKACAPIQQAYDKEAKGWNIRPLEVLSRDGKFKIPAFVHYPLDFVAGVAAPLPVLYFIHGGGFDAGVHGFEFATMLSKHLKGQRLAIVTVDYRLSPEFKMPTQFEDSLDVWWHVINNAKELSLDANNFVLGGGSAGGNLAACLAVHALQPALAEVAPLRQSLRGLAVAAPTMQAPGGYPLGRTESMARNTLSPIMSEARVSHLWKLLLDGGDLSLQKDSRCNPLLPDLQWSAAGLETVVLTASCDPLQDEGRAFAKLLRERGSAQGTEVFARGTHVGYSLFDPNAVKTFCDRIQQMLRPSKL